MGNSGKADLIHTSDEVSVLKREHKDGLGKKIGESVHPKSIQTNGLGTRFHLNLTLITSWI